MKDDFEKEEVGKIGVCECCESENVNLRFSPLFSEWLCCSCWEYKAEL